MICLATARHPRAAGMFLEHVRVCNHVCESCSHVCADHKGIRTTGADFVTNDQHRSNIDIVFETTVDKINFEEKNGQLEATSVVLVDKNGAYREVKAKKEIIVSGGTCDFGRLGGARLITDAQRCILLAGHPSSIGYRTQGRARETRHQVCGGCSGGWKEFARSSCQ